MTEHRSGEYVIRIIGAQAIITGPQGLRLVVGQAALRNMLGSQRITRSKRTALELALRKLEEAR